MIEYYCEKCDAWWDASELGDDDVEDGEIRHCPVCGAGLEEDCDPYDAEWEGVIA